MLKVLKDREFLKKFMDISLPIMISSFVSFFVNFLDNLMVGTVSNEAVSGVYAANQVTYLYQMSIFGILEGAGIFIQQYNGTKDYKNIKACYRIKMYLGLIMLFIMIPLIQLFGKYMIMVYCYKDQNFELILNEGMEYLKIALISYIPFMFSFIFFTSLREMGNTKDPMISSIIAIITNAVFNSIFIFGFKMGVKGAAYGTLISRIFELSYLLISAKIKKYDFSYQAFKTFKVENKLLKAVLKKTLFLYLNEMGFTFGMILQSVAFSQRDNVLSSISIVTTITQIFAIFGNALSVSIGVIVGSELGRDEYEKAKDSNKKLFSLGLFISLIIAIVLALLSPVIPLLFTKVDEAQKVLATKLILIYSCVLAFQVITLASYYTLRTGGRTLDTFILDTGSCLLLYVPVSFILSMLTNIDMVYIYLIVRSIDIIKAIVGIVLIKQYKWVKNITVKNL